MYYYNLFDTKTNEIHRHLTYKDIYKLTGVKSNVGQYVVMNQLLCKRYKVTYDEDTCNIDENSNKSIPQFDLNEWDRTCRRFR